MLDDLRERLAAAEKAEKDKIHELGVVRGYQKAVVEILAELESERPTTDCAGTEVETAARNPKPEKR
jgi:hypothetical protein